MKKIQRVIVWACGHETPAPKKAPWDATMAALKCADCKLLEAAA